MDCPIVCCLTSDVFIVMSSVIISMAPIALLYRFIDGVNVRRKALTFNFVINSNFIKPQRFYGWERVRINQLNKSCPY